MTPSSAIAQASPASVAIRFSPREDKLIQRALAVLEQRLFQHGPSLTQPADVRRYLRLQLATQPHEVFALLFLDNRHRVLAFEPLFFGTLDGTSVHPRVVLKRALDHNCAAVILAHNHPSGAITPSAADRAVTQRLQALLTEVDIRVLDHFIVGHGEPFSFAEAGLL